VLIDALSGQVLCTLEPDRRMFPASLTKMMTAILAAERLRPEEMVTVSPEAAAVGETSLKLKAGDRVTVRDLLTGAVLKSANDAAEALAVRMAGSPAAFVKLMNQRAAEMGLRGTHFCNPHGLQDPRHYTTAADLAALARCFWEHPLLRQIAGLKTANLPTVPGAEGQGVWNHNRLVTRWGECTGLKAGYTRQAGNCVAASARQGGWDLICVVLDSREVWGDARSLLEWGFANFRKVTPTMGAQACQARVWGGEQDTVEAALAPSAVFVVPRQAPQDWQVQLYPQDQRAPVRAGQTVGYALVHRPGQADRRLALVAVAAVPAQGVALGARTVSAGGLWGLLLMSLAVLLYGTATKTRGARRTRIPAGQSAIYDGGAGDGGGPSGRGPLRASGRRPQPGASGRAPRARGRRSPLPPAP
jgi:D-alanyl-D-alanine carboxypeptidase (penicillin-binding protein 5/6)